MSQANELQRKAVWFLPYRGEFGHKVMWYAPFVQGFPVGGRPKVVICEYGEEALFPGCATIPCGRREDPLRREWSHDDAEFIDSWRQSVLRMGVSPAQIISPHDGQVRGERHPIV